MGAQLYSTQKKGQNWVVRPIFDIIDQKCQNPQKWALLPIFDLFFGYYGVELPYFLFLNMKQQTWKNIFPTFFSKIFRGLVPRGCL